MNARTGMAAGWIDVCAVDDVPRLGSRVVARGAGLAHVALFRTESGAVFALEDRCPHRGGPLSQGIVHGARVACPLHNWNIELASGEAVAPDQGRTRHFEVRVEGGRVWLAAAALDARDASPAAPACPLSRHAALARSG
jgi:nitrite reductase (NADH) small subunit